jgi:AbrB family looped-hinge helix DNA binding protein
MAEKTRQERQEKAEECFYGTVTVGERGQVVIPAELRKELEIQAGDKLLIWKHPSGKGVMLFPIDAMREFMNRMLANLEHAERGLSVPSKPKEEGERIKDEDTRE